MVIYQPESFFCHACLLDKLATQASPDPRYCQSCYAFLLKEAELLPPSKHPAWIPIISHHNPNLAFLG